MTKGGRSVKETIYDVFWKGPFAWKKGHPYKEKNHVLYCIEGTHSVYGRDVLLYIGKTNASNGKRLPDHEWWVVDEPDSVKVRVASVGEFTTWEEWKKKHTHYPKADAAVVEDIEALLIYAHQPAYNAREITQLARNSKVRLFNSGRYGLLLPELSYLYYKDY